MQTKFEVARPFIKDILHAIKKDIKTDYLPGEKAFYRTHFGNRPINRLTSEEIFAVCEKELLAGNETLDEWVVNRWVFKHGEIYRHFADRLSQINAEFAELKELTEAESQRVLDGTALFGAVPVYLFSVLNGVVFPAGVFEKLRAAAVEVQAAQEVAEVGQVQREGLEQIVERQQRELTRLEDKIAGVMRKYSADVEALKKQIRSLQQKLNQK